MDNERKTEIAEHSSALMGRDSQTSMQKWVAGILQEIGRLERLTSCSPCPRQCTAPRGQFPQQRTILSGGSQPSAAVEPIVRSVGSTQSCAPFTRSHPSLGSLPMDGTDVINSPCLFLALSIARGASYQARHILLFLNLAWLK